MSLVDNLLGFLLYIMHIFMRNESATYVQLCAQQYNIVLCIYKYAQLKIGVMGNNGMLVMGNPWGNVFSTVLTVSELLGRYPNFPILIDFL